MDRDPLPDASADLLARLAVATGEAPSAEAAANAAASAAAAADALRPDAVGAAAAVCAERGHWDALTALVQVHDVVACVRACVSSPARFFVRSSSVARSG